MKREKGFTLIELMVAIAILVIIVGMMTPLMSSITRSNKKAQDINELDLNIGKSIDVFKKAVRSSNDMATTFGGITNPTTAAIYLSENNGDVKIGVTTSTAIVINVPKDDEANPNAKPLDERVIFYFDSSSKKLMLNSTTSGINFAGVPRPVELVENVHEAHFGYENNIATIYMKVKLDKKGSDTDENNFKKVRDAAVTRININF